MRLVVRDTDDQLHTRRRPCTRPPCFVSSQFIVAVGNGVTGGTVSRPWAVGPKPVPQGLQQALSLSRVGQGEVFVDDEAPTAALVSSQTDARRAKAPGVAVAFTGQKRDGGPGWRHAEHRLGEFFHLDVTVFFKTDREGRRGISRV